MSKEFEFISKNWGQYYMVTPVGLGVALTLAGLVGATVSTGCVLINKKRNNR